MKCKPGVLAYITRDNFPQNIGRIVEVVKLAELTGEEAPGVWWECEIQGSPAPYDYHGEDGILQGYCNYGGFLDDDLTPISGVPVHDEEHNEVTA